MIDGKKQIALIFMMTVATNAISILIFIFTGLIMIHSRPRNSFVQLTNGKVIQVTAAQVYERTPQTIRKFVKDSLTLMFNWNGYYTDPVTKETKFDVGIPIGDGKRRVPTVAMYASFAFQEQIRTPMLEQIAPLVPANLFDPIAPGQTISSKPRCILIIYYLGDPLPVSQGVWKIEVVSGLIQFDPLNPQGKLRTEFNKIIRVRAVEPSPTAIYNPSEPEIIAQQNTQKSNQDQGEKKDKTVNISLQPYEGIDEIIRNIRESGLEIIGLQDI
jgi:hypothetical protein